jgi:hypothetical protein
MSFIFRVGYRYLLEIPDGTQAGFAGSKNVENENNYQLKVPIDIIFVKWD